MTSNTNNEVAAISGTAQAAAAQSEQEKGKLDVLRTLAKTMGISLDDELHKAQVVRLGDKITIPSGMGIDEAIKQLKAQQAHESQQIAVGETIHCAYWDGCHAMFLAMSEIYGWVNQLPGFWSPAAQHYIAAGYNTSITVPHGEFQVPNIEGVLHTGYSKDADGRIVFKIDAHVLRRDEHKVRRIIDLTRRLVRERSIYRGKAFRMEMTDRGGKAIALPEPKFLDLTHIDSSNLILPRVTANAVAANIFTPILHKQQCKDWGVPFKRGHILAGPYGTGKTMTAYVTGMHCEANGITFIYCSKASDLAEVMRFAEMYQPVVVFCEDVDRVTKGERTAKLDDILNIIDGVESKGLDIMTIVTTNHLDTINEAMLRPGRVMDSLILYTAPDAEAAERLIRKQASSLLAVNEDIKPAAELCAGMIPAVIQSVVDQAKLYAIKDHQPGSDMQLTSASLIQSAESRMQQLAAAKRDPQPSDAETFYKVFQKAVGGGQGGSIAEAIVKKLKEDSSAEVCDTCGHVHD